jgi:hypothetical protein
MTHLGFFPKLCAGHIPAVWSLWPLTLLTPASLGHVNPAGLTLGV